MARRCAADAGIANRAGHYELKLTARAGRSAGDARMVVRIRHVVLRLRERQTSRITRQPVTVVRACEEGTTPADEDPIDWLLCTHGNVETCDDATLVIFGYTQRWRVGGGARRRCQPMLGQAARSHRARARFAIPASSGAPTGHSVYEAIPPAPQTLTAERLFDERRKRR
jgi:hypothetical protein